MEALRNLFQMPRTMYFAVPFKMKEISRNFRETIKLLQKYTKRNEIEVRFVNGRKPEFLCELCTPNLEMLTFTILYVKEN